MKDQKIMVEFTTDGRKPEDTIALLDRAIGHVLEQTLVPAELQVGLMAKRAMLAYVGAEIAAIDVTYQGIPAHVVALGYDVSILCHSTDGRTVTFDFKEQI